MNERAQVIAPQTQEGYAALHFAYSVDWQGLRLLPPGEREKMASELVEWFATRRRARGGSHAYSLIGGKGDLLVMHLLPTIDDVHEAEIAFAQLAIQRYLEVTYSYFSVAELSAHGDAQTRHEAMLTARGIEPGSEEWAISLEALQEEDTAFAQARLEPVVPSDRYVCFYPMSKRRGELVNWYTLTSAERGALMRDHAQVGRKYAGRVLQLVTGSVGLDDYEWGVTLFAADAINFKKLIYEMRFDPTSAHYAEFGPFFVGIRLEAEELAVLLEGRLPRS